VSDPALTVISGLAAMHLGGFAAWNGLLLALLVAGCRDAVLCRRQFSVMIPAMVLTLTSGWGLAFAELGPPRNWSWTVNAMQSLGIVMAVVTLVLRFGLLPLLEEAITANDAEATTTGWSRINRLIAANLILASIILVISVTGQ
jgi:uncharacterized membrane protein